MYALGNQIIRVTRFIGVIWNRTCSIFEVCLYIHPDVIRAYVGFLYLFVYVVWPFRFRCLSVGDGVGKILWFSELCCTISTYLHSCSWFQDMLNLNCTWFPNLKPSYPTVDVDRHSTLQFSYDSLSKFKYLRIFSVEQRCQLFICYRNIQLDGWSIMNKAEETVMCLCWLDLRLYNDAVATAGAAVVEGDLVRWIWKDWGRK